MSYGNALYLPYATGCLAAYAWGCEEVKAQYRLADFLFRREPLDRILQRIVEPSVMAFACYTWTFEYNKLLAAEVKKRYPSCLIIFGGHQISENNELFDELPYVDVFIYGEGEIPFKNVLQAFASGAGFSCIPNIAYREDGFMKKNPREHYKALDGYRSPYLEGYFDTIVADNPDTEFCAVVETNRGCPYQCAYCDWCFEDSVRLFPVEKVQREIVWCSKNKVEYIFCADSNFGILKRDLDIARFVVQVRKEYGYPHIFNTCFAKNSNDTVFEISKMFYDNKINKAATLAYQTANETALANVNRKNFTIESFASLVKRYNEARIPTYTEMILGLPGETYDSFCDGLCNLIEAGQQSALTVYYCQVYANSLMGKREYREKYGIETARVPLNYLHSSIPKENDVVEYTDLVIATRDLPFRDMIRSILFCTCLQCFHHIGLLKFFSIYLRKEKNVSYRNFYTSLLSFLLDTEAGFTGDLFRSLQVQCGNLSNGEWSFYNEKYGEIGWFLEEGAFLEIVSHFDVFWKEIMPFLKSFEIEEPVFSELCKYQKFIIRLPGQKKVFQDFQFDFYSYFFHAISDSYQPLQKKETHIEITIPEPVYDWKDYARKVMLFAKRRGDTILVNDTKNVKLVYKKDKR